MKSDSKAPIRIRARDVREVSPWQLPDMTDAERERLIALAQRKEPDPEPELDVKVVEEEIYAEKLTLSQWEAICEEARAEGFEQGKGEGFEAGRQEGFEQGLQQGLDEGRARIEAQLERLKGILDTLARPLDQQSAQLEALLVNMVTDLARAVVGAELATRPELLQRSVADALACVPPHSGAPVLRLHPDDCALLSEQAEKEGWELVEDPSLTPGGCILDAGSAHVDVSVESRFAQVADQLSARLMPAAPAADAPEGDA